MRSSAIGYATSARGLKWAGAASSPSDATRKSPVLRLLNSTSSTTSPCQLGVFVTSRSAYAAAVPLGAVSMFRSVFMSAPHEHKRPEQDCDRRQHAKDGPEV